MEKNKFRKLFPNITEEIENRISRVDLALEINDESRKWRGYNPDIIDFICRCETSEQAYDIISFIERRGKITYEKALELKKQLTDKGVRSFGRKRQEGFYHNNI